MNNFNISISGRFKQVRLAKNLTQQVFAKTLGFSQSHIAEIERGDREPSRKIMLALKSHFRINIDWLLTGEGEMFIRQKSAAVLVEIKDIPIHNMKAWLDEFWDKATEDEKAWLKIEFGRAFPEFKDWLLKKGADANETPLSQSA